MKKYLVLLLVVFTACLLTAGCLSQDDSSGDEKVLVLGEMWGITSIDPVLDGTTVTEKMIATETLIGSNDKFELQPNLASSWKQVNDTVWEFKLREDVKFHNGKEMTATEVKASLEKSIELSPTIAALLTCDKIVVIDKYTFQIHTTELNPLVAGALHYPSTAIFAPETYDSSGKLVEIIGTGPMKMESFNSQTGEVILVKNEDWWGGMPNIDKLIIRGYSNPATRAMMIETGSVDMTFDPPYSEVNRLDAMNGIYVEKYDTPRLYKFDVNLNHPNMADLNVRKAITHAIDRNGIVDNVLYGVGSPAGGVFLPSMAWANTDLKPYSYDPTLAKEYLAQSGWTDTNGDGYVDKNGETLRIKMYTYIERPGLPPMQEAVAANLKSIGIAVEETTLENTALSTAMADGTWDLYLSATNLAMVPDPEYVLKGWYTSNGTSNTGNYSNPVVDQMILEGHSISDINERYDHFRQIEKIVYDDLSTINVAYYGVAIVMKDNVTGYVFDPTAHDYKIDPFMTITS